MNEDNIFSFQIFLNAFSCAFVPEITYFYYDDTPDSTMEKMQNQNISSRFGLQFTEISSFYRNYAQKYRNEDIYESVLQYTINNEYFY
ncbi:MAG: hypothetical protein LBR97_07915, partial [Dysgonamonadaceae bacterium]|nr:hypothetical protein [Dysgonamonadaceae bacterium]